MQFKANLFEIDHVECSNISRYHHVFNIELKNNEKFLIAKGMAEILRD